MMERATKILALLVSASLLAALSVVAGCAAEKTLADLIPENVGQGWETLLEGPIDPQELDNPSPVVAAYVRAWQLGNGLVWGVVHQFADSANAKSSYDSVKDELSDVVQTEAIGDEGVSLLGTLGLRLYLFQRGRYLVVASSAITDPDAPPPDVGLVQELAAEIDRRIRDFGDSIRASALFLGQTAGFWPAIPPPLVALTASTDCTAAGDGLPYSPDSQARSTTTDVKVGLWNVEQQKDNGKIGFRIKHILESQTGRACKYKACLYITKIEGIVDDGDTNWGITQNCGDLFVAGEVRTACGPLRFITEEICDFCETGSPKDFITQSAPDGYFVRSKECQIDCAQAREFEWHIVALVRDNDTDDILDFAANIFDIIAVLGKYVPQLKKYQQVAKLTAEALKQIAGRTLGEILRELPEPEKPIDAARAIRGDDIGECNISSRGTLPDCPCPRYELTISSSDGGSVTTPGEGKFTYDEGEVVKLVATPDPGYLFVEWTGNVGTIADVKAASTTITMRGNYTITANFEAVTLPEPPPPLG